ncbi:hypothetical protein MTO96_022826 [Rhipicephalus appendiculatus]
MTSAGRRKASWIPRPVAVNVILWNGCAALSIICRQRHGGSGRSLGSIGACALLRQRVAPTGSAAVVVPCLSTSSPPRRLAMAARSRSWGSDGHWKRLAFKNLSIFRDRGEDEEECSGCVRLSLPDVHMEDAGGRGRPVGQAPALAARGTRQVGGRPRHAAAGAPALHIGREAHAVSRDAARTDVASAAVPVAAALASAPRPGSRPVPSVGARSGIQPDLYRKKEAVFFQSRDVSSHSASATLAAPTHAGRLHFRLKYDFDKSDLVVHVIEDSGAVYGCLQPWSWVGPVWTSREAPGGFGEPCVRVALLPEVDSKQRQALMRRRSTDPLFDETFKFPVSFDDVPSRTLLFQVFDYDRYSRNDVTGEVRVPLADVDVTTETEVWCDIEKTEKAKRDWPELLLSLSYLPSAGRLTVVILEAANLVPDSDKDKPDTCVKVSLTCGDRKTKKRKTSVKKGSAQPAWNEALSFDVTEEQLSRAQLCVQVCRHGSSGVSCSASLGGFQLGPGGSNVTEEGQRHWKEMLANPRKAMSRWHALQPNP